MLIANTAGTTTADAAGTKQFEKYSTISAFDINEKIDYLKFTFFIQLKNACRLLLKVAKTILFLYKFKLII